MKTFEEKAVFSLTMIVFQILILIESFVVCEISIDIFGMHSHIFDIKDLVFIWAFGLLSASFIIASAASRFLKGWFMDVLYRVAMYWFGLVTFLFAGTMIFLLASYAIYNGFGDYISPIIICAVALGLMFLVHLYATFNAGWLKDRYFEIEFPKLPENWRGKKIVFISDLHIGDIRARRFASRSVRMINSFQPDAVFIGGDLFDGQFCDFKKITEPFLDVRSTYGIFFITGNHEYFLRDLDKAFEGLKDNGIKILNNESVDLDGIKLIGVDYEATKTPESFSQVMNSINGSRDEVGKGQEFKILLKHEPTELDTACDFGISLGLYGHTHAGQVFPMNFLARFRYKGFAYGLKDFRQNGKDAAIKVYTSSGAGTGGPPIRLGSRSEVVCIKFL